MSLFKSEEEKRAKKIAKEEENFNKLVKKYKLTDIDKEDYELIKNISDELVGTSILDFSLSVSLGTSPEDKVKINRLSALQEQNWIIINQLGRINKNIKELIEVIKNK